jgi:hypothetical protein
MRQVRWLFGGYYIDDFKPFNGCDRMHVEIEGKESRLLLDISYKNLFITEL